MNDISADKLTKIYIKIRDKRKALKAHDDSLKAQQDIILEQLLAICNDQGAATIRTEYGTVSRREAKRFWTSDWEAFYAFINEHKANYLLQQRIHTDNMEKFLEGNEHLHPPGLNIYNKQSVVITKR